MEFRVGPYVYRVQPVTGYIQHEGDDCLGLCDNELHVLYVSDQASPTQQIQVLYHEYMEAWYYHFGQKLDDKEDWCDLFGMAMAQFMGDFGQTLKQQLGVKFEMAEILGVGRDAVRPHIRVTEKMIPPDATSPHPWRVRIFETLMA